MDNTHLPSLPATQSKLQIPAPTSCAVASGSARVTYDRVGGGWHPSQQWTDRVNFQARPGETDEQAAFRVFQFDYHPQARVLRIEFLQNCSDQPPARG